MFSKEAIQMKAKMLCQGVTANDQVRQVLRMQNPNNIKRGGLSSGIKLFIKDNDVLLPVNAPVYERVFTPIYIKQRADGVYIVCDKQSDMCFEVVFMTSPDWYSQNINGYQLSSIFTKHNLQIATSVYEYCDLFDTGNQCKFCVINKSQSINSLRQKDTRILIDALKKIPAENYHGITLNGGMTYHPGRGMELLYPHILQIRKLMPEIPIAIEMTPPADISWIDRIIDAGANSIMMNLECWDDKIRDEMIPGKNQLCPKEQYLQSFDRAVSLLGPGKVSTCFVFGCEPVSSLKIGIEIVAKKGVIPSILAGRHFEDIEGYPFVPNVSWREFLEILYFSKNVLAGYQVYSTDQAGCVACGMCDLIKNI